jgi:CubicO group peptidase (beta-lactamase class C family)
MNSAPKYIFIVLLTAFSSVLSQQKKYDFSAIDEIIDNAIRDRNFPSAVLVVGDSNKIIYQNAYGRLTYDDDAKPTTMNTIYDLASVTKVIATTSAVIKLYEEGKVDLDAPVAQYIPQFAVNNKGDVTVRNLLLHNSGLTAWTPFYQMYSTAEEVRNAIYSCSKEYETGTQTIYSDYNAVLLGDIVEKVSNIRLDKYCKEFIFLPLGMTDSDYLIPISQNYRIAPTEYDTYWRNELLIGYVHDETAALLEGVSGNAGLFSTGPDLYKFMKMMLKKGRYIDERKTPVKNKKEQLFKEESLDLFTTKVTGLGYLNTRALGWDTKPEPTKYPPQCGYKFSQNCFGHTGYTGTSVWCDKDKNLIIIFLTNRIYPKRGNEEIKNIRPKVHDEVCKIMGY